MRILLAAAIFLMSTHAFAACEPMRPSTWGDETLAQAAYAACLRRSIEDQRIAQRQAEYQLKLKMLELQLQQQRLLLPSLPPIAPAF